MVTDQQSQLSPRMRRLLSTRKGIMTLAAGAAVLGGAILILFLSAYRNSLTGADGTKKVLVAKALIEEGSPADEVAAERMWQLVSVDKADLDDGAVRDPDVLKGKITKTTIYPDEQITRSDFRAQSDSLGDQIRDKQRAISLPFTPYGGLAGDIEAGDKVDVIAIFNVEPEGVGRDRPVGRVMIPDIEVLKASEDQSNSTTGASRRTPVVLRAPTDQDAVSLAFAAEEGAIWLALRPQAGAETSAKLPAVGAYQAAFGLDPIPLRTFKRLERRYR